MKTPEEWWVISQRVTTQPAGFIKLIEAIQRDAIESVKKPKQQPKKQVPPHDTHSHRD